MRFDVITLFPEMVSGVSDWGIMRRAAEAGIYTCQTWNPRDFTTDKHRTVDDRPYGGGPGMVMMYEPLLAALTAAKARSLGQSRVICLSPQGRQVQQQDFVAASTEPGLTLISGRYEGIDERFIERHVDEEWSVGDYVLSGGELPAMMVMDAIVRLLPGALGHSESAENDSFMQAMLDWPHYTRPDVIAGKAVPDVLLSGDHQRIDAWRRRQALMRTCQRRPDLIQRDELSQEELNFIEQCLNETKREGKGNV